MCALREGRSAWLRTAVLVLGLLLSGRAHVFLHGLSGGDDAGAHRHAQHLESQGDGGLCTLCHLGGEVPPPRLLPAQRPGLARVAPVQVVTRPTVADVRGGTPPRGPPVA